MILYYIIVAIIAVGATLLVSLSILFYLRKKNLLASERKADEILRESRVKADKILTDSNISAKETLLSMQIEFENEKKKIIKDLTTRQRDFSIKESNLLKKTAQLAETQNKLETLQVEVEEKAVKVDNVKQEYETLLKARRSKLEEISGISSEEAHKELLKELEYDARKEATKIIKRIEENARDRAKNLARIIIAQSLEKNVLYLPVESVVSVIKLPSDEMKGRIIGREGRNIRAIERATGVDIIVDDTPETIMLSCHNPLRREIAKVAIEKLVEDGRIHPGRIEEIVQKTETEIDSILQNIGREALFSLQIHDINEHLMYLIGSMKMRSHISQNLLEHCMEVAHVATYMGQTLEANCDVIRRASILHEIGHIELPRDDIHYIHQSALLAKRYGESQSVCNCIMSLHPDTPPQFIEAYIFKAAEILCINIPGIRREGLEKHIEHLDNLEKIALGFQGVTKAYAMKAGREIIVIVDTERVNDDYTAWLAKDIAARIENETRFSGQVKVSVIRESRAIDYAT